MLIKFAFDLFSILAFQQVNRYFMRNDGADFKYFLLKAIFVALLEFALFLSTDILTDFEAGFSFFRISA